MTTSRNDLVRALSGRPRWVVTRGVAVLVLVASSLSAHAAEKPAVSADQIDELLGIYQRLGLFNGSVLVADQGEVIIKKGYGLANMEWEIPNSPDTKFRLGSITKQFTATLILRLVEQGHIELDSPVTRYLPGYPADTGNRVTIHQLLNHTSGIPGYTEIPAWRTRTREPLTHHQLVTVFSELDLLFEPGTRFSYSNSGYFLLGTIIERITGQAYEDRLRDSLLEPLGMNDTGYDSTEPLLSKRAAGYSQRIDGSYVNAPYLDMGQPYAAGSLYSTVGDLYRWDQALYTDAVLSVPSRELMFTPGLEDYGYGWTIRSSDTGPTVEHGGGINGFNTLITRNPESKRLIILLNNTGGAPLAEMARSIRMLLDGDPPPPPKQPAAPRLLETYDAAGLGATLALAGVMQTGSMMRLATISWPDWPAICSTPEPSKMV